MVGRSSAIVFSVFSHIYIIDRRHVHIIVLTRFIADTKGLRNQTSIEQCIVHDFSLVDNSRTAAT